MAALALGAAATCFGQAPRRVPVVTVLADFEDDSIAPTIGDVKNAAASDCAARTAVIPARGQRCLTVEIGATAKDAYTACDLTFRLATKFTQADRVAAFCWIKRGAVGVAFRVRDARGQVFETAVQPVREFDRWVRIDADLARESVRRISAASPPRGQPLPASQPTSPWNDFGDHEIQWPIELRGFRVTAPELGQQVLFIDDIQVEHRTAPVDTIHGDFAFNKPTKIYAPGATVATKVVLENRSRTQALRLAVELAWLRPDGTTLRTQQGNVQLPPSGVDFRSRQPIDFSLKIDEPGLYRLVARARAAEWPDPNTFETTIAVLPSNRELSRGRSTFFGVRTNLLREPRVDQMLEVEAVREIGVHLLAIDTPWKLIEPKRDEYDFEPLKELVGAVTTRGMAVMLVLTDPPNWIAEELAAFESRQSALVLALAAHFGEKVQFYQILATDPESPASRTLPGLVDLQKRLASVRPNARVVSPATLVAAGRTVPSIAETAAAAPAEWAYETAGPVAAARRALRELGAAPGGGDTGRSWSDSQRWFHLAEPLVGVGHRADAEDVLSYCVDAAAAGVAGVVWYDLRDDDNEASGATQQNGLLQRDLSPKATLWGFASAVGLLTGLRHAGDVHGAPEYYASALFMSSEQQTALLQPRPNRIPPAVIAPIRGVPGTIVAQDFERRGLRLLESGGPLLLTTPAGPLAVTLKLETAQPQPQLGFSKPWLRTPALVFADPAAPFTIEIDPPMAFQRSYLQITLPDDAPFQSSVSARALSGPPGETITTEVTLTPKSAAAFERHGLTVKLSVEGKAIEFPVEVRPALSMGPAASSDARTGAEQRVGQLAPRSETRATASGEVSAAWSAEALLLRVTVTDDKVVGGDGDVVMLGVALENTEPIYEVLLRDGPGAPVVERAFGASGAMPEGWQVQADAVQDGAPRTWHVRIPAMAFGVRALTPGSHALLAARYDDDDGGRTPTTRLSWGSGLDGGRSSAGFVWVRLQSR